MKKFTKILAFCGILAISNLTAQEIDGAFVGVEVGAGSLTAKMTSAMGDGKTTMTDVIYGGKVGYKVFFNDWLGLRAYLAVDYMGAHEKEKSGGVTTKGVLNTLSYTANADVLFDFYGDESVNYGAFVGIGLGGASYKAKGTENIDTTTSVSYDKTFSGFYADVKLGLRAQAGHSGFDFIVGIPLIKSPKTTIAELGAEGTIKQDYRIAFAYSYTF